MKYRYECGAKRREVAKSRSMRGASVRSTDRSRGMSTLVLVFIVVGVMLAVTAALILWYRPFGPPGRITGSGNLATEEMDFSDFTIVEVGYAFEAEITQSNSYSVSITADDNLFDYIQVSKTGGTLRIGLKPNYSYQSLTLRAEITMPDLQELEFSGATHGTVEGFSSLHNLVLDISGASSLDMVDVSAGDIEINLSGASTVTGGITASGDAQLDISGASTIELEGAANDLLTIVSGASRLELSDFPVHNANVNLSGASQATINLDGILDADLSGASHLYYIGEPTLGDIETSGGSTISK